uniref:Dynamin N-terminal domain-containing protein n=1 Tax=Strongyloides stercoralis TaxID=6248 RepID=A0A0K0DXC3_STRER
MSSLICCNKCFFNLSEVKNTKFFLLKCLHIICQKCIGNICKSNELSITKTITCSICTKNVGFTIIGKDMKDTEKELFEDISIVIKKMEARLLKIVCFQNRQQQMFDKNLKRKLNLSLKSSQMSTTEIQENDGEDDLEAIKLKVYKKRKQLQIIKERCKKIKKLSLLDNKSSKSIKSVSLTRSEAISLPLK